MTAQRKANRGNWLCLYRRIVRSNVAQSDELLGLFVRLLASVNFRSKWFRGIEIMPGQMAFAWRKIQERLYPGSESPPSKNTITKRLKQLCECEAISISPHPSNRFSVLTIPNWEKYQPKVKKSYPKSGDDAYPESETIPGTVRGTIRGTERRRTKKVKNTHSFDCELAFKEWYSIYPRKVAKDAAEKAYAKAIAKISKDDGVDSSQAAVLLLQWTQERLVMIQAQLKPDGEDYRSHPATWLNKGQYRDALTTSLVVRSGDRPENRPFRSYRSSAN